MGVTTGFVAQQLAVFGIGLFELNAFALGCLNEFASSRLQQLAVGGVGNGVS